MPNIPVRNLAQGQGVNYDKSPNSLPPNAFSELRNARVIRDRIERIGGTQVAAEAPTVPELTNSRFCKGITRLGSEGLCILTSTNAYITFNGTTFQNVTPAAGWADTKTWNLTQYGDQIMITSLDTDPFVLKSGGSQFVPFTNWLANYQVQKLVPYKNILIGIGVEISNTEQSGLVIWSDVVDPDNIELVAWDPQDPTTVAGRNVLSDKDGGIRDAGVLRDSLAIYTDSSVWRADLTNLTAGVTPLVFNFRKVFGNDGIFQNRCFAEVDGRHYVVGRFEVYIHDLTNRQTVSDNRFTEFLLQRFGTERVVFVEHYERTQEILILYGAQSDTEAREALCYNYFYDAVYRWGFGGGLLTHFTFGPDFGISVPTWADLQANNVLWSDLNQTTWNQLFPQNRDLIPYGLGKDKIYGMDRGGAASSITPDEVIIERIDLDFDEVFGNAESVKYIDRFVPQVQGEGQLRIQFGGRNALTTPVIWDPERIYTIGQDYKFDLRISTRYPAYRILQNANDGTLAMDGFDLSIVEESYR